MEWNPTKYFSDDYEPTTPFALLVLNQPINANAYKVLKKHSCFVLCADGGANRFYDLMKEEGRESDELPDAIVGDLDSIQPQVHMYYEERKVKIIYDEDQYSTDFNKCLRFLRSNEVDIVKSATLRRDRQAISTGSQLDIEPVALDEEEKLDILVLGGLGGRVDQGFAQVHQLYTASKSPATALDRPSGELLLVSEESIAFVLPPGRNIILTPGKDATNGLAQEPIGHSHRRMSSSRIILKKIPSDETKPKTHDHVCKYLGENIGIIPIAGRSIINTSGLEWDVQDWQTEFGGQVSTSNHIRSDVIEIETTAPVLFAVELADWLKSQKT